MVLNSGIMIRTQAGWLQSHAYPLSVIPVEYHKSNSAYREGLPPCIGPSGAGGLCGDHSSAQSEYSSHLS